MFNTADQGLIPCEIPIDGACLNGDLCKPDNASGLVVFAHGSGSSRFSPRNRAIARTLRDAGFATLLLDLLTESEEAMDEYSRAYRFDIVLLAERLIGCCDWLANRPDWQNLNLGFFGASTGAAAALVAAAALGDKIKAIVSRGGRPDLAGQALARVTAPTLLIVGSLDIEVIALNREAQTQLKAISKLAIIPGASHLFPEPGALEQVGQLARRWFDIHLAGN